MATAATSAAPGAATANKAELLAIADSVAREKLIDRGIVIEAMEDAIQRAARARYGAENDIRAKLDPVTGELRLWRVLEVIEGDVEDYYKQVDLKGAQRLQADATIGDFIVDPLPPIEFGRIAAQAAKQVIFQKVRCSRRKCRRSTTASSRSRRPRAIRAAAPRSASSATTARSTRSAPASA
jgi:N utilization substance protein A